MRKLLIRNCLVLFGSLLLLTSSCTKPDAPKTIATTNKPDPQLSFKFVPNASGSAFLLGKTFTNPNGQRYELDRIMFYMGQVRLVKTDGSEVSVQDILLVNFDDKLNANDPTRDTSLVGTAFSFNIPEGNYKAFRFGIGVPKKLDGQSQSGKQSVDYPVGHPLNGINRGFTYWDWQDLYRFSIMEGHVDTSKTHTQSPDYLFSYHTGYDSLYREVEIVDNFSVAKGDKHNLTLYLDVDKIFYNPPSNIDMIAEHVTNMNDDAQSKLGVKIINNLKAAISK